jgi:hypothetical protein
MLVYVLLSYLPASTSHIVAAPKTTTMNKPFPAGGGYYPSSPSTSGRGGRYKNSTSIMLVDVPNMNDDDILMTSQSSGSSRGGGSSSHGGGDAGGGGRVIKKKKYSAIVPPPPSASIVPLDERIKYIEYKDHDEMDINHDIDEIITCDASTSTSSSQHRRNRNNMRINSREGVGSGGLQSSPRLQQQQNQLKQNQQKHLLSSRFGESSNEFASRLQQLQQQHHHVGEEEDEEGRGPITTMRNNGNDNTPTALDKTTNNSSRNGTISRNSAIFEILWGQDGIYIERGAITTVDNHHSYNNTYSSSNQHEEDDDDDSEYSDDRTIRRNGMKHDISTMRKLEQHKIQYRCQKLFSRCSGRLLQPLMSYMREDLGISQPIWVLSCGIVCFVVVLTVGVLISMTISHHIEQHQEDGGGAGASYTLSVAQLASMSNSDRLILAEQIDHICDKLHSTTSTVSGEMSSEDGGKCWSLCHEKRCCFVEQDSRRRLDNKTRNEDSPKISFSQQRMKWRQGGRQHEEQTQYRGHRRLQLAHSNIPGETDFTYIAHKVSGSETNNTTDNATTSTESAVTNEEGEEESCTNDPNEYCTVYAGCAPVFGK